MEETWTDDQIVNEMVEDIKLCIASGFGRDSRNGMDVTKAEQVASSFADAFGWPGGRSFDDLVELAGKAQKKLAVS